MSANAYAPRKVRKFLEREFRKAFGSARVDEVRIPPEFDEVVQRASRVLPPQEVIPLNEIAEIYDKLAPFGEVLPCQDIFREGERISFIASFIDRRPITRLLSSGCGVGLTEAFLATVFPNLEITCADVSPVCVEKTRERCKRLRRRNVSCVVGSHEGLAEALVGETFDLVLTKQSLDLGRPMLPHIQLLPEKVIDELLEPYLFVQRRRASIRAFQHLLGRNGSWLVIQQFMEPEVLLMDHLARKEGFTQESGARQTFSNGPLVEQMFYRLSLVHGRTIAQSIMEQQGLTTRPFTNVLLFQKRKRS